MKRTSIILMLLLLAPASFTQNLAQEPKLIYVQQVFRHGHREPMYPSTLDGSNFVNTIRSYGQLTKQGKSMHYILGQNLYKFYWNQLFAGTPYDNTYNQSKFYVKSTNINRTIESAFSQLLGIFQNLDKLTIDDRDIPFSLPQWPNASRQAGDVYVKSPFYHPVPVHVEKGFPSPWDNGDFLRMYSKQFCPNQLKWRAQNQQNPDVIKIVNDPSFQKAIASASNVLKTNLTFWDIYKYYTNAVCMHQEGRTVDPIWINPSATKTAMQLIKTLQLYIKLFYQEKQKAAITTGYFNETYNQFKRVIKDQSGVQWAFYSGHDATIAGFLIRLNMTNVNCIYENYLKGITKDSQTDSCVVEYPQFASTLIFEVYKYKNNTFAFKIRYNGYLRKIPFCDNKLECPVERYYDWFQSWRVKDVVRECGIVDKQKKKARTYLHSMEIDLKMMRNLQKQLKHYKHQAKRYGNQLEDYRKMQIEFKEMKKNFAKSELIRTQQKKVIETLMNKTCK